MRPDLSWHPANDISHWSRPWFCLTLNDGSMKTKVYSTADAFDALAAHWNSLLQASAADTPFLTREWQTAFWRALGEGDLRIVAAYADDGKLIGIGPLYSVPGGHKTELRFIGGVDPSDYLDFIIVRGREADAGAAILDALAADPDWQIIDLYNIPEDSPTRTWLTPAAAVRGWTVSDERQTVTPKVMLNGSFDEYVASLDKRERHELRRKLRRAAAIEGLRWYLVDGEFASELEPEVDAFLDLMIRSRPDKADFMTPRMRSFFYEAVRAAHRGRWLQLAFLEIEGRKVATYLSFDYGDRLMVYNSGYEPDSPFSPGIVLIARLIERAVQHGKHIVDFMRGDEEYKYRLGAKDAWVHRIRVVR